MKSTFKTLFYLKKNEPKKNGHVVIMVRITVDGDQVQAGHTPRQLGHESGKSRHQQTECGQERKPQGILT